MFGKLTSILILIALVSGAPLDTVTHKVYFDVEVDGIP